MPHGWCFRWEPALIAVQVLGNLGIAFAYFAMPLTMGYLLRRKREISVAWIPPWVVWMAAGYAGFILLCGITHVLEVVTIWSPIYWIEGWVSVATAIVSLAVAVSLFFIVPNILATPERIRLELTQQAQQTLDELAAENASLQAKQRAADLEIATLNKLLQATGREGP